MPIDCRCNWQTAINPPPQWRGGIVTFCKLIFLDDLIACCTSLVKKEDTFACDLWRKVEYPVNNWIHHSENKTNQESTTWSFWSWILKSAHPPEDQFHEGLLGATFEWFLPSAPTLLQCKPKAAALLEASRACNTRRCMLFRGYSFKSAFLVK